MKSFILTLIFVFVSGVAFGEETKKAEVKGSDVKAAKVEPKITIKTTLPTPNLKPVVKDDKAPVVKVAGKVEVKAEEPKKVIAPASMPALDGGFSGVQAVNDVKIVIDKSKDVSSATDKSLKMLAIFALLAAIFKVLLSFLKLMSKWFVTDKGKLVLKLSTLVLGTLTYLVSNLALGMGWADSLWLAFSGPGAIIIHEFSMLIPYFRGLKDKKEAVVVNTPVVEPPSPPVAPQG